MRNKFIVEILIGIICSAILISRVNNVTLYLTSYIILIFLSTGKIVMNQMKEDERVKKILFYLFAIIYTYGLTYLLLVKLGVS